MSNSGRIRLIAMLAASSALAADRHCELLKADELNAIFGTSLRPGVLSKNPDGKPVCKYVAADATTLMVGVTEKDSKAAFAGHESASANIGAASS